MSYDRQSPPKLLPPPSNLPSRHVRGEAKPKRNFSLIRSEPIKLKARVVQAAPIPQAHRMASPQHHIDYWIAFAALALLSISILMVYSTTAITSYDLYGSSAAIIQKHLFFILLGFGGLYISLRLEPELLYRAAPYLLISVFFALVLVLIPGLGVRAGGAARWLALGPLRIQPGETAKLAVMIYMATYIGRHHERMFKFGPGVIVPACVLGLFALLLLREPDFGSTAVIAAVMFFQLTTASRLRHLVGCGIAGAGAAALLIATSPYRMKRFETFLNPFEQSATSGYQLIQSLIAVGSGGITGTGLGEGHQKLHYLPAAHTDFIFAVIAEELGLLGALVIISLFLIIAWRGFVIARRLSGDAFLCALSVGSTTLIVLPAMLNIAVVCGMLPTKGMVLPLVAYGGTAMIIYLFTVGLLLRLSRIEPE